MLNCKMGTSHLRVFVLALALIKLGHSAFAGPTILQRRMESTGKMMGGEALQGGLPLDLKKESLESEPVHGVDKKTGSLSKTNQKDEYWYKGIGSRALIGTIVPQNGDLDGPKEMEDITALPLSTVYPHKLADGNLRHFQGVRRSRKKNKASGNRQIDKTSGNEKSNAIDWVTVVHHANKSPSQDIVAGVERLIKGKLMSSIRVGKYQDHDVLYPIARVLQIFHERYPNHDQNNHIEEYLELVYKFLLKRFEKLEEDMKTENGELSLPSTDVLTKNLVPLLINTYPYALMLHRHDVKEALNNLETRTGQEDDSALKQAVILFLDMLNAYPQFKDSSIAAAKKEHIAALLEKLSPAVTDDPKSQTENNTLTLHAASKKFNVVREVCYAVYNNSLREALEKLWPRIQLSKVILDSATRVLLDSIFKASLRSIHPRDPDHLG
ncbi:hypothetical protein CROQUDRAFT_136817 [Cronartium quercuum f. sp. fusiforme G11]|uniref:Uncharacterized protein n=1 Tax=Cronartium quercuum f. sp. fusiforme G11 TaxID=708437 RepID=A0A9P6NAC8_9BASI|nr:hypothetical protein CROQUDRAFT_136817 [Cronartium quercuum f. sp. fusiforme G11]